MLKLSPPADAQQVLQGAKLEREDADFLFCIKKKI